jgi:HlyD family secretion protein
MRSGRGLLDQRRGVVGGVVVAVSLVLAGVVAASGSGGPSYRTANVEQADVDATLDSLGTIQPVNQANLSFPVAGNVRTVSAAVGQHVTVGQTLAQLDTTSLDAEVASAQSAVAAAQARLATDESSQTSGPSSTAVGPAGFSTETTSVNHTRASSAGSPDATTAARDLVTRQQARLVADQHRVDQDIAQEKRNLAIETSLCQAFVTSADSGKPQTSPSPLDRHSASSSAATTTAPPSAPKSKSPAPTPSEVATTRPLPNASKCESALTTVLANQVAVDHDQQAVTADLSALDDAIDKLLASTRTSDQPQPLQERRQPDATTGSPGGGAGRAVSASRPASAEQLVSDQAAIDAAQAQLAEVQQARNQAELRSPIDGTVGSVTISVGQSVQGSSGTPQIVVIGPGSHQVTTSISDANMGSVHVGDAATITPSGSSEPLHGQVISIGLLASSGSGASSESVSYPVTIGLTPTEQQLFAGQSALVSIMLAHASGTLTVPSSAVHHAGANNIVSVLRNGTPSDVLVTLGAAGPIRTQVLAGLNPGDQVILADLSQPLPTIDIQNIRRATGGDGRAGG